MLFSESLKKNRDFRQVYQNGRARSNSLLVMYVLPNTNIKKAGFPDNRIGISVSKKVGNSVVRHRLIRRLRECYRLNEVKFVRGLDIVIVVRPGAKEKSFLELERALLNLAERQKITANDEISDH